MATDGPKIIDGDTAHDTYWGIRDMYDNGFDIKEIKERFPIIIDYLDEFEYEIYVTSLALAFWEIGAINEELIVTLSKTIEKGVGVKFWSEEVSLKEGKIRKKELKKLLAKVLSGNPKVRNRKKYTKVSRFHFQPGDILTFKLPDKNYCAVICAQITQYRGQCTYDLVTTTYKKSLKPTLEEIKKTEVLGRWIGTSFSEEYIKEQQPEIGVLWKETPNYHGMIFGISYRLVTHKDFYTFKDRFEKIGSVNIKSGFKRSGSYGYEESFERFEEIFSDLEGQIKAFSEKKFRLELLIE